MSDHSLLNEHEVEVDSAIEGQCHIHLRPRDLSFNKEVQKLEVSREHLALHVLPLVQGHYVLSSQNLRV